MSGSRREPALAFALYLALAVVATYPLAFRAKDHVFGDTAQERYCVGTPPLNVWAMGFVLHQLPRDPLHLFDGNVFHPYRDTLAFSEHLFLPALLVAPVYYTTGNLVLAYNTVSLASLVLAGLGMFLLARELGTDRLAAFGAGVLYAFHSFNVNELIRIQTLSNQWFPFLILALARFFARPSAGRAALAALCYLAQSLSGMYWALYAPFLAGPVALFLWWRQRPGLRALVPLAACFGVALVVVGLFFVPYLRTSRTLGFTRAVPNSMPADRYVRTLPRNLLYRGLLDAAGPNENASHFLGFSALPLALLGLARRRGAPQALAHWKPLLAGLVVFGFLMSLGPRLLFGSLSLPGPYGLFQAFVPGFRNVRYPERFSLFLLLGLAPLVAGGLASLRRLHWAGRGAIVGFLFVEHLAIPLPLAYLPPANEAPEVYRWLARQQDVNVVAEVPASRYRAERPDAVPMYFSTVHWKRTVQAYSGYFPPTYQFLKWRLFHFPAPESVEFLARFGVDTVVVAPSGAPAAWSNPRWTVAGPFAEGHLVLRLKDIGARPFTAPRPDPGLVEVSREGFGAEASPPGAELALDGSPWTSWSTRRQARKPRPPFFQVSFEEPIVVSRVSLELAPPEWLFPTSLKVVGQLPDGRLKPLGFDERAAYDGLVGSLLHDPLHARMEIDIEPRRLSGLVLRRPGHDEFELPWQIAELRVYSRR